MTAQTLLCSSISIFYAKPFWHKLGKDCLLLIINDLENEGVSLKYSVIFSTENGSHIRFFLFPNVKNDALVNQIVLKIEDYIRQRSSLSKEVIPPFRSLFMDFPNNSVYKDLHHPPPLPLNHLSIEELLKIQQAASNIILRDLCSDKIDSEAIFTTYLYMLIVASKEVFGSRNVAYSGIKIQFNILKQSFSEGLRQDIENKVCDVIKTNSEYLLQLIDEFYSSTHYPTDLRSLRGWGLTCSTFRQSIVAPAVIFMEICGIIQTQLGIKNMKTIATGILLCNELQNPRNNYLNQKQKYEKI